jgi:hypothetical protein
MTKVQKKPDNQDVVSEKSYFETRMTELGITPEDYPISVFSSDDSTAPEIKEIFSKDSNDNIRIHILPTQKTIPKKHFIVHALKFLTKMVANILNQKVRGHSLIFLLKQ